MHEPVCGLANRSARWAAFNHHHLASLDASDKQKAVGRAALGREPFDGLIVVGRTFEDSANQKRDRRGESGLFTGRGV